MPPRSDAPGLKGGRYRPELGKRLPYWHASQVVRDTMGFPDKCIALPPEASDAEIGELCRQHTARLHVWIDEQRKAAQQDLEEGLPPLPPYSGTIDSACECYERHPRSRFRTVKANTRKSYLDSLKLIRRTVGKRLIRNLTVLDFQHWYDMWRLPAEEGGAERIKRAHDAIAMVKTVLRFNAALRREDCKRILQELENATSLVSFERGGAREQEMTYAQARTFVESALELQGKGVLPGNRGLYMAIGVATMFELLLRQKDAIGERPKTVADLDKARRRGAAVHDGGDRPWSGYFTWENIPGWRWRMKTSKSKYRAAADFDLTKYGLLFPLLEAVPHSERQGPIIKGEHGLAIQERSFRKWFRPIARASGIPDDVKCMDLRAGGATEAEAAVGDRRLVSDALTHTNERTTGRYIRRVSTSIATVADARQKKRATDQGGQ